MGAIAQVFRRAIFGASLEDPRFTLNDPAAFDYLGSGGPASSGLRITPENALTFSPWWKGVNLISSVVGRVPAFVFRRDGDDLELDPNHQAYKLIRYKPNPFQTAFPFKQQLQGHALTRGNGFGYIERDGLAAPLDIWPMDPDSTYVVKENGRLWYVVNDEGTMRKVRAEDMLHIHGLGFDGLCGYSVTAMAKEHLGLGLGALKAQSFSFKNAGRPAVVLEVPGTIQPNVRKEIAAQWKEMHEGIENTARTAILDRGMKANAIAFSNEDMQLLESRKLTSIDIANYLMLPPHKVGSEGPKSYGSLEQENQSTIDDCYDAWFVVWEEQCRDKLCTEQEKEEDTHVVQFDRKRLVVADLNARANYHKAATGGRAWETPDEARKDMGLDTLGGKAGELVDPTNNFAQDGSGTDVPKKAADEPAAPEGAPEETPDEEPAGAHHVNDDMMRAAAIKDGALREAVAYNLSETVRRMVQRLGHSAERAAKDPKRFMGFLDAIEAEHGAVIAEALDGPIKLVRAIIPASCWEPAPWLMNVVRDRLNDYAGRVTAKDLAGGIAAEVTIMVATLPGQAVRMVMG